MKAPPKSPYLVPGFYARALDQGRHRDIVGGRWDETGRLQMALLQARGMQAHHRLLDIGAGSLRLGCKAVPFLHPGHYWATDASRALMLRGRAVELPGPDRRPEDHLVEDAAFALPGIPPVDFAIAFGVFTHLPAADLGQALAALRQPDGVVTHPDRPPWHMTETTVRALAGAAGLAVTREPDRQPRGQVLWVARVNPETPPRA